MFLFQPRPGQHGECPTSQGCLRVPVLKQNRARLHPFCCRGCFGSPSLFSLFHQVGFSLSRVRSGSIHSYSSRNSHGCPLERNSSNFLVLFLIDIKDLQVQVRKYGEQRKLFISPGLLPDAPAPSGIPKPEPAGTPKENSENSAVKEDQAKPGAPPVSGEKTIPGAPGHSTEGQPQRQLPTRDPGRKEEDLVLGLGHLNDSYNFSFHVVIGSREEEGQYSLNFHNCHNSIPGHEQPFDLTGKSAAK
ncbi:protein GPR108-like [Peromyscus maniculatus bairdii]|uniref:protein GPR108-like n=1 Tax=Peromyscus maniculatus bairdii TaxID=230844 RepID=UPI003FD1CCF5